MLFVSLDNLDWKTGWRTKANERVYTAKGALCTRPRTWSHSA